MNQVARSIAGAQLYQRWCDNGDPTLTADHRHYDSLYPWERDRWNVLAELVAGPMIKTKDGLMALEDGVVVRSEAGTIACRYDGRYGVVFGDERPFPWDSLALPVRVLWSPS